MAVKKLKIPCGNQLVIESGAANALMDSGDGLAALLYLYILSHNGEFDDGLAASRLKKSSDEISAALNLLIKLGLVGQDTVKTIPERPDTLPEYSPSDIACAIEKDEPFKYLLDFTQKKLGKLLSTVDTQTLLGIYSWMGLPVDVICLIITSCIDETRKKYGEGRMPTMRGIESRARLWANLGIMTQEQAEEYLKKQERLGTRTAQIARLINIGGRALSPTESRYIDSWIDMDLKNELIIKAYDITVIKTGGLKWKYMDTILKSWHSKGFTTAEQVGREDFDKPQRGKSPISDTERRRELDEIRRLKEINRKRKGSGT